MISSEVQRTLVKSPPELWAEISDPDALARHLGEFGEIRITRLEPEQRVEWQAGETSGSVVIKPSGWGTKVKLTVTRELDEAEAEAEAEGAGAAEAEGAAVGNSEGTAVAESEGADAPDAPGASTGVKTQVATEADDAQVAEFAQRDAPDSEAEADADTADASNGEREFGQTEPERAVESLDAPQLVAPEQAEGCAELQAAPEPRRGFFARLFGRRRATRAVEPIDEPEPPRDAAPQAVEPARYNALAVWASQIEAGDIAGARNAPSDAGVASEREDAAPQIAPLQTPPPGEVPSPGAGASTQAPRDASPSAPESPGAGPAQPDERALGEEDAPADISAEIRQAEEVAAEEVTAVLSGVLDRLGAAHHRPFSRA
jgi:hypothetical protein